MSSVKQFSSRYTAVMACLIVSMFSSSSFTPVSAMFSSGFGTSGTGCSSCFSALSNPSSLLSRKRSSRNDDLEDRIGIQSNDIQTHHILITLAEKVGASRGSSQSYETITEDKEVDINKTNSGSFSLHRSLSRFVGKEQEKSKEIKIEPEKFKIESGKTLGEQVSQFRAKYAELLTKDSDYILTLFPTPITSSTGAGSGYISDSTKRSLAVSSSCGAVSGIATFCCGAKLAPAVVGLSLVGGVLYKGYKGVKTCQGNASFQHESSGCLEGMKSYARRGGCCVAGVGVCGVGCAELVRQMATLEAAPMAPGAAVVGGCYAGYHLDKWYSSKTWKEGEFHFQQGDPVIFTTSKKFKLTKPKFVPVKLPVPHVPTGAEQAAAFALEAAAVEATAEQALLAASALEEEEEEELVEDDALVRHRVVLEEERGVLEIELM